MILGGKLNRNNSRLVLGFVLLCAVVVVPFGVAFGQDHDTLSRRLKAAVEAGEIPEERAQDRTMLVAPRKDAGKNDINFDAIGRRLRAAVAAGEITGGQARAMMGALNKSGSAKKDNDYKAIGNKIKAAVAAGKITEEEAKAKWAAIKKKGAEKKDIDIDAIGKKIRAAVQAGKITAEEAKAKMVIEKARAKRDELLKKVAEDKRGVDKAREYLMQVRMELGAAVRAGRISKEDAIKKFKGTVKAIKEKKVGKQRERDGEHDKRERPDWDSIVRRIEGAVKRGDITGEEADAKYVEIKERMAGSERDRRERGPRAVYAAAEKEIKAAIEAGKITEEQGRERLEGLKKHLAERARGERTRDR